MCRPKNYFVSLFIQVLNISYTDRKRIFLKVLIQMPKLLGAEHEEEKELFVIDVTNEDKESALQNLL